MLGSSREELVERARTTLGFDGARQAAEELLDLARREAPQPASLR